MLCNVVLNDLCIIIVLIYLEHFSVLTWPQSVASKVGNQDVLQIWAADQSFLLQDIIILPYHIIYHINIQ